MKRLSSIALVALALGMVPQLCDAAAPPPASPAIYVRDLTSVDVEQDPPHGPISRLRARIHTRKADANASNLSLAIVKALNAAHVTAQYLPPDAPTPAAGWLITGSFSALNAHHALISIPLLNTDGDRPNAKVELEVRDLAIAPSRPFAAIGEDYRLKGQGSAFSTSVYLVAAKLVYDRIETASSTNALARKIADKLISSCDDLAAHDRPA
jgi:hypothetical protein